MTFSLNKDFIEKYSKIEPPFGFNGLGKLVYMRTYSRIKNDGSNENWFETIRRVVEGTYTFKNDILKVFRLDGMKFKHKLLHRKCMIKCLI